MRLLVLSDLHIDTGDHYGTFGWDGRTFKDQLVRLMEQYGVDQVILNGDIFELYKYPFMQLHYYNGELIRFLLSDYFYYIKGNHDAVCPFGNSFWQHTNSSGQSIYIEHGHKADRLNGSRIGRGVSLLFFKALRQVIHHRWIYRIYHKLMCMYDTIHEVPRRNDTYVYLRYALRLLKNHDMVILGHTHKMESHHTWYYNHKKRYLNTGSCSHGKLEGIILDTESLHYEFVRNNDTFTIRTGQKQKEQTGILDYTC